MTPAPSARSAKLLHFVVSATTNCDKLAEVGGGVAA
jgi:hypothetical protein